MMTRLSAFASGDKVTGVLPDSITAVNTAAALRQPEFIGETLQLAIGCASNKQEAAMLRQAATIVAS